MPKPQSSQSHAALDPVFHFFIMPLAVFNLISSIWAAIRFWPAAHDLHLGWIIMSLILLVVAFKTRVYGLRNQDRMIRLEERLRLAALAPSLNVASLSTQQLIALRFASDAEAPALAARTLKEGLDTKAIKSAITSWRPDDQRI